MGIELKAIRRTIQSSPVLRAAARWMLAPPPAWWLGTALERTLFGSDGRPQHAPIFVVGPARSGTTLVYQALCYGLQVTYVNNAMARLPMCPAVVARAARRWPAKEPEDPFSSRHGVGKGWSAPSQANRLWQRWFHKQGDDSVRRRLQAHERADLLAFIAAVESIGAAPFVAKSPGFSTYLSDLVDAVGDCLVVRIHRDPLQTAQSVLKARRAIFGNPYTSISRLPVAYEPFRDRGYPEQICAYVLGIEAEIDMHVAAIGADRVFDIGYEHFCGAPRDVLASFRARYIDRGGDIREQRLLPIRFTCSRGQKVSDEDYSALKSALRTVAPEIDAAMASYASRSRLPDQRESVLNDASPPGPI